MMTKEEYEEHVKKLGYELEDVPSYEEYKKRYEKAKELTKEAEK